METRSQMTCPGSLDGSHEAVMHRLIHLTIRWIAGMVGWLVGWLVLQATLYKQLETWLPSSFAQGLLSATDLQGDKQYWNTNPERFCKKSPTWGKKRDNQSKNYQETPANYGHLWTFWFTVTKSSSAFHWRCCSLFFQRQTYQGMMYLK